MKKTLLVIVILALTFTANDAHALFGWLKNKEKKESTTEVTKGTASNSAAIDAVTSGQKPQPNSVTQAGTNNVSTVINVTDTAFKEAVNASQDVNTKMETESIETSFLKSKFPTWIALLGFAGAGFAILALLKAARKSSASFNALYSVADNAGAKAITSYEALARSERDPEKQAIYNGMLADLNKFRGQVNSAGKK